MYSYESGLFESGVKVVTVMVRLLVKRGDENQFLYETTVTEPVENVTIGVTNTYNGRLKISRLCGG